MKRLPIFSILAIITVFVMILSACAPAAAPTQAPEKPVETAAPVEVEKPAETEAPVMSELPAFDSACTPDDEGTVKPVDKKPDAPLKIAVLGLENNPFWIPVKEGTLKAAEELAAYDVTVDWIVPGEAHTGDFFGPGIESAIVQEYDAIATIAGEAGVAPFIDKAVDAGIPVATFNSETATVNKRAFFVGADLYLQGETACTAMAEAIGGKGKVAIITGFFAVEAHELRRTGFVDKCKAEFPEIEIVGEVENQDKGDTAYTQAQDFMSANPELAGIYVTAGGPFGAAAAVDDAGKAGKVQVVSFDFVEETMQFVDKGVIYATIGQDPFAQGHDPAIRLFNYMVGGVVPECGRLVTRADIVTKENIADFWTPSGEAPAEPEVAELPAFDSACTPDDEGTVKPVDMKLDKPMKIAVLGLENNPFWIPVKEGTLKAAEELAAYGVTVDWIVPGEAHTGDFFGPGIESAIVQEYDAIATIAGEAGVAPFIDKAVDAGIPVATFNSETATVNKRAFFVGADLYLQGETACTAMAEAIGGKGKVAIITGFFAVEAHELRRTGFVDKCKAEFPEIEIVGEVENQDKGDTAYTQAQDFMSANPELAGIYVTAGGPFGAAAAVKDAGLAGKVWVVSFDFVDETMQFVKDGVIYATIGQDPFAQGHDPAIRLFNYMVGGVVPQCGRLVTRADIVTAANIDDFWTPPQ